MRDSGFIESCLASKLPFLSDWFFGVAVFHELMKYFQQAAYRRAEHEVMKNRIKNLQTKKNTIYTMYKSLILP